MHGCEVDLEGSQRDPLSVTGAEYADGSEISLEAVAQVSGICPDRGADPSARYRRYDRDFHPGARCPAEIAAGRQAGRAVPDRRQGALLRLWRLHPMGRVFSL